MHRLQNNLESFISVAESLHKGIFFLEALAIVCLRKEFLFSPD